MPWQGYIAIFLSLGTYIGAQTFAPGIGNSKSTGAVNGTQNAADGLEQNIEWKKCDETKIIYLGPTGNLSKEDIGIIQSSTAGSCWSAALLLFFIKVDRKINDKAWSTNHGNTSIDFKYSFNLVRNLFTADVDCFVAESWFNDKRLLTYLRGGSPADCLADGDVMGSMISACVFSKALLEKFAVAVVYPPLDMFRDSPFHGKEPQANKELFKEYFHWNAKDPIKMAIVFSRETYDYEIPGIEFVEFGKYRAGEVTRWLKALPEGEGMHVFTALESDAFPKPPEVGNSKDVAVLLFGGNEILVEVFSLAILKDYHTGTYEDQVIAALSDWKINATDKWPQNVQMMCFVFDRTFQFYFGRTSQYYSSLVGYVGHVFGDDMQVHELVGAEHGSDEDAIVFIGFPEL